MKQITILFCFLMLFGGVSYASDSLVPENNLTSSMVETMGSSYQLRIKEGDGSWVVAKVDSFFLQYTYNKALTAEPQFAIFEADGDVEVEVKVKEPITSYKLRPSNSGITVNKNGQTLSFVMNKNTRQLCLEINGQKKKPFLIFKNPVTENAPTASDANIQYFGPGNHKVSGTGAIGTLITGTVSQPEIIYLAKGAVVEGRIDLSGASNVVVMGSGILYNPPKAISGGNFAAINISNGTNIKIEGITCISRPDNWGVRVTASDAVEFDNFKLINEIRDGLDPLNSQNITVKNSFIMAHDDAFCLKGVKPGNNEPVENILVDNCILANMAGGNAIEIGYESVAPYYKNITFSNIKVIYSLPGGIAPDSNWPEGTLTIHPTQMKEYNDPLYMGIMPKIENVTYRNIQIESCEDDFIVDIFPNRNSPGAGIKNITFENITVIDSPLRPSKIIAREDHPISNISFSNFTILGTPVKSASQGNFTIEKAANVVFK